jgi:hypothetical protein
MNAKTETEFDKVLRHAGGVTELANKLVVAQGIVSGWKSRGVSQGGALAIEATWPRKFKAIRLVGAKATKCFERATPKKKAPRRRARA